MGPREGHDGRMGRGAAFTQSLLVPYYASSQPGCLMGSKVKLYSPWLPLAAACARVRVLCEWDLARFTPASPLARAFALHLLMRLAACPCVQTKVEWSYQTKAL